MAVAVGVAQELGMPAFGRLSGRLIGLVLV